MAIFNEMLGGGVNAKGCNATAADILSGKTAAVGKNIVTGTMTNNGAVSKSLNAGASYTIPKGYHNGSGKVTANSLASQNAVAPKGKVITNTVATGQTINAGDYVYFDEGTLSSSKQLSSTTKSANELYVVELENNQILLLSYRTDSIWGSVYNVSNNALTLVYQQSIYTTTWTYNSRRKMAVYLGNNKVFILCNLSGLYITVGSSSITVNKFGTVASGGSEVAMCQYSSNQICLTYRKSDYMPYFKLITFTNTSFSLGTEVRVPTKDDTRKYSVGHVREMLSDKKVVVSFYDIRSEDQFIVICEDGSFGNISYDIIGIDYEALTFICTEKSKRNFTLKSFHYNSGSYVGYYNFRVQGNQILKNVIIRNEDIMSEDDFNMIIPLYNGGVGVTTTSSANNSDGTVSYDDYRSKYTNVRFYNGTTTDGYENCIFQMYDGTILIFWNQTSSYKLYYSTVSRPYAYKAEFGTGVGVALTSGSAGDNIQICVPYK